MGGKGSGGLRAGAGRKANTARVLALHGGRDRGAARPVPGPAASVERPDGLADAVGAVWDELAPHAVRAGTLVPGTVTALGRLCRAIVTHQRMEAQIARDGLTYLKVMADSIGNEHTEIKAHPLLSRAEAVDNKIRSWLKDFGLNPFGKPLVDSMPKPADPFAEFEATG